MKIIESIEEMKASSQVFKDQSKTIASIATFGDFHAGHISLIELAKANADIVVMSKYYDTHQKYSGSRQSIITEYMETYFTKDIKFCELHGVDLFWNYVDNPDEVLSFKEGVCANITSLMLFFTRRGRCAGPIDIYARVWPQRLMAEKADFLILGKKDFHQNMVMGYSIKDLNLPIKLVTTPIVRDSDGLPFSSRNSQLTKAERGKALSMPKTLKEISEWSSYPSVKEIKKYFISAIKNAGGQTWYADVCDATTAEPVSVVDKEVALAVGTHFGGVFLSDNIRISPK